MTKATSGLDLPYTRIKKKAQHKIILGFTGLLFPGNARRMFIQMQQLTNDAYFKLDRKAA